MKNIKTYCLRTQAEKHDANISKHQEEAKYQEILSLVPLSSSQGTLDISENIGGGSWAPDTFPIDSQINELNEFEEKESEEDQNEKTVEPKKGPNTGDELNNTEEKKSAGAELKNGLNAEIDHKGSTDSEEIGMNIRKSNRLTQKTEKMLANEKVKGRQKKNQNSQKESVTKDRGEKENCCEAICKMKDEEDQKAEEREEITEERIDKNGREQEDENTEEQSDGQKRGEAEQDEQIKSNIIKNGDQSKSIRIIMEQKDLIKAAQGLRSANNKIKSLEEELEEAKTTISRLFNENAAQQKRILLLTEETKKLERNEEIKALMEELNGNKKRILLLQEEKEGLKSINRILELENSQQANQLTNVSPQRKIDQEDRENPNSQERITKRQVDMNKEIAEGEIIGLDDNERITEGQGDKNEEITVGDDTEDLNDNEVLPDNKQNPVQNSKYSEKPCRYKENCYRENCRFVHPKFVKRTAKNHTREEHNSKKMCKYGKDCRREMCWFFHPERGSKYGNNRNEIKDERRQRDHRRIDSDYVNERGEEQRKRCKYGTDCQRKGCWFSHQDLRGKDDRVVRRQWQTLRKRELDDEEWKNDAQWKDEGHWKTSTGRKRDEQRGVYRTTSTIDKSLKNRPQDQENQIESFLGEAVAQITKSLKEVIQGLRPLKN